MTTPLINNLIARAEAAEAKLAAVEEVMREFYKVRGDYCTVNGAEQLKAALEKAINSEPTFELPTEAGVRFTAKNRDRIFQFETVLAFGSQYYFTAGNQLAYTATEVMQSFTDFRMIGAEQ